MSAESVCARSLAVVKPSERSSTSAISSLSGTIVAMDLAAGGGGGGEAPLGEEQHLGTQLIVRHRHGDGPSGRGEWTRRVVDWGGV